MTWHTLGKIVTQFLAIVFAAGGVLCGVLGWFILSGGETVLQEICGILFFVCGGTLLTCAMLCAIADRLCDHAQRERRAIEILEDIEAELTRQGKAAHQPWHTVPPPVLRMKGAAT